MNRVNIQAFHLSLSSLWLFALVAPFAPISMALANETLGDFGGVGLLQTPTARFAKDGAIYLGYAKTEPYRRYFLTLQPLPWLESTVSYTRTRRASYSVGQEDWVDKRFDAKIRLFEESRYRPQLALGLRDFAGTGLFASEYLVASKRFYAVDFSLGLGWGYLGSSGSLQNPLGILSDGFRQRRRQTSGSGGVPEVGQWFHGDRVGLFGGINYRTPIKGLSLKLEWDPNDYSYEPYGNVIAPKSSLNVGLTYQFDEGLDLALGVERGDTLMVQIALHGDLNPETEIPRFYAFPEKISRQPPQTATEALSAIHQALANQGQSMQQIGIVDSHTMELHLSQERFRQIPIALGRAARTAHNHLPQAIKRFRMVNLTDGLATAAVSLQRKDLDAALHYAGSVEEIWSNADFAEAYGDSSARADVWIKTEAYPACGGSMTPRLRQHIGGALDTFYAYQLWLELSGECAFTPHLKLAGSLGFNMDDTFDQLDTPPASQLPHVRTDIQQYFQQGKHGITKLALNYQWKPAPAWYARLTAGILEEMYAGIGGETLYRPYGARWALGADVFQVRKRAFNQRFGLQSYGVTTGHATLYYDSPFQGVQARLSIGRYLAGDVGATLDVSRRFQSGARIGAFVTVTDVAHDQFGEGSFDKGIYLSLPLDLFMLYPSQDVANFVWRPLTRDGGQKLQDINRLYELTQSATPEALARDWSGLLN